MNSNGERQYAIAVRDNGNLFLFLRVRRKSSGDAFVILPRPHDTTINAHASYHADGRYHIKPHGRPGAHKFMYQQKQKPDQSFFGTEHVLEQTITLANVRSIGETCNPSEFADVFEISAHELETKTFVKVTTDLVSRGYSPRLVPGARVIRRKECQVYFPYVVFTLYEMPEC